MTVPASVLQSIRAALPGERVEDVRPNIDPTNPPAARYVVVTTSTGARSRDRYTGDITSAAHTAQVMCIGPTREDVQWLARKVADRMMTQRISAPGWRCSLPKHPVSRRPDRDDAVTARPLLFTVDEFDFTADRI